MTAAGRIVRPIAANAHRRAVGSERHARPPFARFEAGPRMIEALAARRAAPIAMALSRALSSIAAVDDSCQAAFEKYLALKKIPPPLIHIKAAYGLTREHHSTSVRLEDVGEGDMNICGVLVHANPAKLPDIERAILALPGVEIHASAPGARLVLTLEDTDRALALDSLAAIHKIRGVVAATLVYHHFEPGDATARNDGGH